MTPNQFTLALSRTSMRGRVINAAKRVLCDGLGQRESGREAGISGAAVSAAVKRIIEAHKNVVGCPEGWECITVCVPPETADKIRELI